MSQWVWGLHVCHCLFVFPFIYACVWRRTCASDYTWISVWVFVCISVSAQSVFLPLCLGLEAAHTGAGWRWRFCGFALLVLLWFKLWLIVVDMGGARVGGRNQGPRSKLNLWSIKWTGYLVIRAEPFICSVCVCVWTLLVEGRALQEEKGGLILDPLRKKEQERKQSNKKIK